MNVIRKLTWQYMKKNKRRTIVTVIGIIISVAMMTAVTTAYASFADLYERKTIMQDGRWHVLYKNVPAENTEIIENDENSGEVMLSADLGYDMVDSENEYKPYIFLKAYSADGFGMVPVSLIEGRLPQNSSEIVIPLHLKQNGGVDWKVGDTVKLTLSDRTVTQDGETYVLDQQNPFQDGGYEYHNSEVLTPKKDAKTYTIVGLMERPDFEPSWAPGYTAITVLDEKEAHIDTVNVSVWQKKVDKNIYDNSEKLAEAAGITKEDLSYNSVLLALSGVAGTNGFIMMMYALVVLLLIIIVISSVSLIYNAFAISLTERSRQLGMLAGVGATKRQKRASVYYEGFLVGIVSIPVGIIAGIGGLAVAFKCMAPVFESTFSTWKQELYVVVSWPALLAAAVVAALTIFISTYIPAKRASKISPIDGIRQSKDIKLTKKSVKTSRLTRKLFGFEGEIALKNLKRNKKRYRATVFSMAVSLALFLGVSGFVEALKQSSQMLLETDHVDIKVQADEADFEEISKLSGIVKSTQMTQTSMLCAEWSQMKLTGEFQKVRTEMIEKENGTMWTEGGDYSVFVYALDDESLNAFLEEAAIDRAVLDGENKAILLNKIMIVGMQSRAETKMFDCKPGQTLSIDYVRTEYNNKSEDYEEIRDNVVSLTIAAVTEKAPWCADERMDLYETENIRLLVTEETLQKFVDANEVLPQPFTKLCIDSDDPQTTLDDLDTYISENSETQGIIYSSSWKMIESNENTLLLISVFAYGFIILMTAICTANIINTTSTGISMRRKEFAMLKSVGMTPKAFNKMIIYESMFYGLKALLFGLPVGFLLMWLFYKTAGTGIYSSFSLPWLNIILAAMMIFLITGVSMMYSVNKIKKENVIEALKGE